MANKKVFPRLLGAREMNKNRDTYSRALVSIIVRTAFFYSFLCAPLSLPRVEKDLFFCLAPFFPTRIMSMYINIKKEKKKKEKEKEKFLCIKQGAHSLLTRRIKEKICADTQKTAQ